MNVHQTFIYPSLPGQVKSFGNPDSVQPIDLAAMEKKNMFWIDKNDLYFL